ncbi:MAG: lysylphosphatidylglycerol synthase transmembrane domain-containing protein [Acidobacteriota bacterium]
MKSNLILALKLVVSAGLLALLFSAVDLRGFAVALVDVDPFYLTIVLALTVVGSIVVPAMVTKRALPPNQLDLSLFELVRINLIVRFYTLVLPRGLAAGVRFMRYRRKGTGQDALALMLFEKISQIFMMTLTGAFFLFVDRDRLPASGDYLFAVALLGLVAACLCLLAFLSPRVAPLFHRLLHIAERMTPKAMHGRLRSLSEAVEAFHGLRAKRIASIFALSLAGYLMFILSPYILTFGMGLDLDLRAIAWIRSLILLMALVPITIAGLGVREAGFVAFLGLYGIPNHQALAFSLVLFAMHIVIGLVGAGLEAWDHLLAPALKGEPDEEKNVTERPT